ncbi:MAG: tRNA-ribosyltransferase [Thermoproteus sp.]
MEVALAELPRGLAHMAPSLFSAARRAPRDWPGRAWLDSGGYRILKGRALDVSSVAKRLVSARAEVKFSLDFPPSPEDDCETAKAKELATALVYAKLSARADVVPVVHFHPCVDVLKAARAYEGSRRIALGGAVPYALRHKAMLPEVLKAVGALAEVGFQVHVFGLASPLLLPKLAEVGAYSADSANWRLKAAHGKVALPWGGERHVTPRGFSFGGRRITREELEGLAEWLASRNCDAPRDAEGLLSALQNHDFRLYVNACVLTRLVR